MRLLLVLGCWGQKHGDVELCRGVENDILDLTAKTERNMAAVAMLDECYHLFDRPLYNNVHTAIYTLCERFNERINPLFTQERFGILERFCVMHAKCGLFLRLRTEEDTNGTS